MKAIVRQFHREDSAQVLAIFALLTFVIIGLMGLATDIGLVYVARAELGRSVDAAALAGAQQLPDITAADLKARAYITENEPGAIVSIEVYPDVPAQQVEVRATKTVNTIFLRALGRSTVQVKNQATAGFGTVPVDAYLTLDATGSMHTGCNAGETNTGGACPIKEARDGATNFVNTLLADGSSATDTVVGTGAFRGCYDPPRTNVKCIDASGAGNMITSLSYDKPTLLTGIGTIRAIGATGQPPGGSGTNICQALKKAQSVIFGSGSHSASNTQRYVVMLTDGDNVYNATEVNQSSPQSPETPCRPTSPSTNQLDRSTNCLNNTQAQENQIDTLSYNMATTLKGQGVEIYVIAFSVCGGIESSATLCNTTGIGSTGTSHPDSIADHRLLKCIASSSPGTNDHFFETATASDLPGIFQTIANNISFRLIK
jgi:Flp pilus assembly protein TadG